MQLVEAITRLLTAGAPAAWTAAAAAYLVYFLRQDAGAERWAPRLAWTAAVIHLLAIAAPGMHGICPMLLAGSVVSGLGLAVGVVHLCLEGRAKDRAIGIFPVATAALFALAGAAADPLRRPDGQLPPGSTAVHVTGAILGYAGLLLAALFGTLYLVQQKALKEHRFGLFWERLPSVELLDDFTTRSLAAGAAFLTATIGLGHVARHAANRVAPYFSDAKIVHADLLWLLCVGVLVARRLHRLRPNAAAVAAIVLLGIALAGPFLDRWSAAHRGV